MTCVHLNCSTPKHFMSRIPFSVWIYWYHQWVYTSTYFDLWKTRKISHPQWQKINIKVLWRLFRFQGSPVFHSMSISSHSCNIIPFHHSLLSFTRMLVANKLQLQSLFEAKSYCFEGEWIQSSSFYSQYKQWMTRNCSLKTLFWNNI